MVNSIAKGKRGEREFAKWLRDFGIKAYRGQQYCGGSDSPDVQSDLDRLHFEVKRVNRVHPDKWFEQAKTDAGEDQIPVVVYRVDGNKEWKAVLRAEDFIQMAKHFYGL